MIPIRRLKGQVILIGNAGDTLSAPIEIKVIEAPKSRPLIGIEAGKLQTRRKEIESKRKKNGDR